MKEEINIVIPMAGAGSRFAKVGYKYPKPLIPVLGKPMIQLVIENLTPCNFESRFIFLCQKKQIEEYQLEDTLKRLSPNSEIVPVDGLTEGAACTVLLARKFIENETPLIIANCDQYIDCSIDSFIQEWMENQHDGMIMTMTADDPKWSYVGFDAEGQVERVVEKEVISTEATVGIYGFLRGKDFTRAADQMIDANDRVKNEFYVAPVYNYILRRQASIGIYNIGSERNGMYGLGIPEDLQYFETLELAKKVCG